MAKQAQVTFHEVRIEKQKIGGDDHLVATVSYTLRVDGTDYPGTAKVHQPHGQEYSTTSVEVSESHGWKGAWNRNGFAEACDRAMRRGIRVSPGASPISATLLNVSMGINHVETFELPERGGDAW